MSSESLCQVARSWVDVGSFHTRLLVRFTTFTASVQNILDTPCIPTFCRDLIHTLKEDRSSRFFLNVGNHLLNRQCRNPHNINHTY
jgi:hypothetical protein